MFPVYTGINRSFKYDDVGFKYVPCIHRDKPVFAEYSIDDNKCSLYTQG